MRPFSAPGGRSDLDGGLLAGAAIVVSLLILATGGPAAADEPDLFAPVEAQRQVRLAKLGDPDRSPVTPETIRLMLETGQADRAAGAVSRLFEKSRDARVARAQAYITRFDFDPAGPLMDEILAEPQMTDAERATTFNWLSIIDDAARIDAMTRTVLETETAWVADVLAAGTLAYNLLDYDRAGACFDAALKRAGNDPDRAAALKGQGLVLYKRRDYDGSLAKLIESMTTNATPEGLEALAETLIRLGRTDDAITACEWSIRLNPYHMAGHYYLGNGYARKNYTELLAAYPNAFSGAEGRDAMGAADAVLASGDRENARRAYAALNRAKPGWADPLIRMASLDFEDGKFGDARELCFQALEICPEYGRAHGTLAKALESQKFEIDVHRPGYEERFTAADMPHVPGIEEFVVNWKSLSARHQKRVALSIDPWKQFIPVLVAGGSTYYIKPLYMLLSETPGQESLRDQRINTDSRLWDDVRGCGGYHTVTGIEDVERTIFDRYNTVLHELTHQVHGVMTADQSRRIQELYVRTKERDEATKNSFLSRYAGGTVWEYFAEGANALESPKRDAYDPREVVRERLETMDPDLMKLVQEYFALRDIGGSYPVAYVNSGYDRMEKGEIDSAIVKFENALASSPTEETAMQALVYGLSVKGDAARTRAEADRMLAAHPTSGGVVTTAASAKWHAGVPLQDCVRDLEALRPNVRAEDRYQVDQALGNYYWALGDAPRATAAYDSVLAYQSDSPEALWGKASALALDGNWEPAFSLYDQAVRHRTGVIGLRCDFARDLLTAGPEVLKQLGHPADLAATHLSEAQLLDPEDPTAEALRGYAALKAGNTEEARKYLERSLEWAPWCDLARILLARISTGDKAAGILAPIRPHLERKAPPEYVYRPKQSTWTSVHELPAVERRLLDEGSGGKGPSGPGAVRGTSE